MSNPLLYRNLFSLVHTWHVPPLESSVFSLVSSRQKTNMETDGQYNTSRGIITIHFNSLTLALSLFCHFTLAMPKYNEQLQFDCI